MYTNVFELRLLYVLHIITNNKNLAWVANNIVNGCVPQSG